MFTAKEFKMLEFKKRNEVVREISRAREVHSKAQQYFEDDGEDYKVEILINNLKRIEAYIRKAENILHQYDDNRNIRNIIKVRKKYKLDMDLIENNELIDVNIIEGEV